MTSLSLTDALPFRPIYLAIKAASLVKKLTGLIGQSLKNWLQGQLSPIVQIRCLMS